jgi:density-regulated protein DRP1
VKELEISAEKKQTHKKKEAVRKVIVKRVDRNKKKHITTISGLDMFQVDLKKTAKKFASRFACGSSVTRNDATNSDEITIQGDVVDEVIELICKDFPQITSDLIEKVIKKEKKAEEGEEPKA